MQLISSILVLALSTSAALAGNVAPLAPGAPAGVKHAQASGDTGIYIVVGVAAAVGIAVAVSAGNNAAIVNPPPAAVATTTTTG
jgi:hypothetical protein